MIRDQLWKKMNWTLCTGCCKRNVGLLYSSELISSIGSSTKRLQLRLQSLKSKVSSRGSNTSSLFQLCPRYYRPGNLVLCLKAGELHQEPGPDHQAYSGWNAPSLASVMIFFHIFSVHGD